MPRVRNHAERTALLFGSEKFGLSNDEMSYCHALIRIPTVPDTPSMNLGQAVAVCLYELVREETAGGKATDPCGRASQRSSGTLHEEFGQAFQGCAGRRIIKEALAGRRAAL